MADVLDQSDVDALLAAASSGQLDQMADAPVPGRSHPTQPQDVRSYDFKRPERVSKDQMRALEGIHEGFSRNLGAALSGYLRTIVEVRVATTEQLTYNEFIHSLPNPTNFNLLRAEPLDGQMCLEISPLIIYPIIDRLLGGSNAELFIPQRPLTMIELRLVRRITDRAMECLTEVWSDLIQIKFVLAEVESNPHLVQIVAPNEVVVVIGFEIKMGNRAGTMSLCMPFNVIEPVMNRLSTQGWVAYERRSSGKAQISRLTDTLAGAEIELQTFLAETTLTVRDLLHLQPGDIIQTSKIATEPCVVQVEGRNKFLGRIGRHKQNRAVKITGPAPDDDRL